MTFFLLSFLFKLNLKTKKVNLVANSETPDESNTFACHLVEKFLFAVCKRFADDVIRQTCADIYFDPSKSSASSLPTQASDVKLKQEVSSGKKQKVENSAKKSNNDTMLNSTSSQQSETQHQKFPQSIGVADVYNTILKHDRFNFLTNKYMAVDTSITTTKPKAKIAGGLRSFADSTTVHLDKLCKNVNSTATTKTGDFLDDSNKNFLKAKNNLKRNFSESSLFKNLN